MKNLCILLSVLFCMVGLSAEVPQNVRATAISYDGFTLRWDPVGGAAEYQVEVKCADITTLFIGFEDDSPIPTNWSTNISPTYTIKYAYDGNYLLSVSFVDAYIQSSAILNPQSVSFYAMTSYTSPSNFKAVLQESNDSDTWQDIEPAITQANIKNSYNEYVYSLTEYNGEHYFRFILEAKEAGMNLWIDNLTISAIFPETLDNLTPGNISYPAIRIGNLVPETEYIYRVAQNGDFSPWQTLTTLPEDPSQNTGSAIAGAAAIIPVSTGDTTHSVTIDPADDDIDADYSVSLSQVASIYKYNISCEDNSALNGVYIISHPGFQASSVNVTGAGEYSVDTSVPEQTTLLVNGISAKGNLEIDLGLEESTLPVTLSNFSVVAMARDVCRIDWITQSESNLIGFYILRGSAADVAEAQLISALIPARNSSTIQQYSYLDHAPFYPAYYWLMTMEISGQEIINGPVYAEYEGGQTETSTEYQDQVRIFPNPFSYEATLQISVAQNQEVAYKLYNIKGEYIRKEEIGVLAKGIHPITFNAINGEGKPLGTGQYILEMQFGEETCLQKLMIIK